MVEYSVILKRYPGSSRPDVCIFQNEDREKAIAEMQKYVKKNGFIVNDSDGRFTIESIRLVEKEPIVGAPILSEMSYGQIFDIYDERRKEELKGDYWLNYYQ